MAELLSQKEIDQLLSDTLGGGDVVEEKEELDDKPAKPKKSKNFKFEEEAGFRYRYAYKSPVYNSSQIVMNPDHSLDEIPGKIVVRTLANYTEHIKYKKGLGKQNFSDLV